MPRLPPAPAALKPLQGYLKAADDFDRRDQTVAFFCRSYAAKLGIEKHRTPESTPFLMQLLDVIEADKKTLKDHDALKSDVVAQSAVFDVAIKLFARADTKDREGQASKEVAQAFYTAMILFEVLRYWGDLDEDVTEKHKYAKWKAAYILRCLRSGIVPTPGPTDADGNPLQDGGAEATDHDAAGEGDGPTAPRLPSYDAASAPGYTTAPGYAPMPTAPHFLPPEVQPQYYPPPPPPQMNLPQYPPPQQPPQQAPYPPQQHNQPTYQPPQPQPQVRQHPTPPQPQQHHQPPPPQHPQAASPTAARRPAGPVAYGGKSFTPKSSVNTADNAQAAKFAKFAVSALQFDDTGTAVDNLLKALQLLTN